MNRQNGPLRPRDPRLDAWRTFLYAHAHVRRQLERELQAWVDRRKHHKKQEASRRRPQMPA